jgi:predicted regulator of Ras-like GTPase activity (Roadblock/LC7/MglB family)
MSSELDLAWLLDDLVTRVWQIKSAVVLSRDGLAMGSCTGLSREEADHLAAVAAGLQGLARGVGQQFGGGSVRQTVIEMESAFLFVTAAAEGSCLAVLAAAGADVGLVAYEMAVLVKRAGDYLGARSRPERTAGAG